MANVLFKKGLLANLPSSYTAGTFYVTTDEKAMYLDIDDSTRIRLGDFQEFATLDALKANVNPSTTAMYYIDDLNVLAKWNGTEYIQINTDTGATSVEVIGEGNAVTAASYDTTTRKLTLTMGETFATKKEFDAYVESNNQALADEISNRGNAVKGVQDNVDALADKVGEVPADKTVIGLIGDAQATADAKVASVTAGDASITVGGTTTAPTVAAKLSADADNALTLAEDGLKVVIPAAAEYSIAKAENSGDYAAVYNLTKDGAIVGTSINIPKDMVVESGSVVENPEGQAEGTYIELKLQNVTEPLYINVGNLIEYVTSGSATGDMVVINVSDDHKVTATITDGTITLAKLTTEVQTAIGKAHNHENKDILDGINADKIAAWDAAEKNAKDHADGLNTAMDNRVKKLEGIDHEAYIAADTVLKGELQGEIEAAKTDASNKDAVVLAEAQAYAKQAKADAIADAKTETENQVKALADGQVATNTANIADIVEQLTWGSF